MKLARPFHLAILGLGIALFLGACGLETYLVLEPAINYSSTGTTLSFGHNTANTDASFLGYEVYYRLYPGSYSSPAVPAQATTDISAIASKTSAASGADQVKALLVTRGFKRMSSQSGSPSSVTTQGNPPLVVIPSASTGTAGIITTMDLTDGSMSTLVLGTTKTCARFVQDSGSTHYLPFSDATYNDQDCDSTNHSSPDYVDGNNKMTYPYLVAYVLAYALQSDFTDTYSYPIILNSSGTATDISVISN